MAVATPCLKFPHSPTTMSSTFKPTSNDAVSIFRSNSLKTTSSKLYRTQSCEIHPIQRNFSSLPSIRRVCSANFENYSHFEENEEFSKKMEGFSFKFHDNNEENDDSCGTQIEEKSSIESSFLEIQSVEMKAKSLELPLSLRMIKRKKKQLCQLQESLNTIGENAYCSVKKAFSSMVFIIRELHSYTLQMRELLYYEDLQGILSRVHREMHASFVWLFQQVFSHTPTLMVYVMILLANFTVHSISSPSSTAAAFAAVNPPVAAVEEREISKFDAKSTVKTFTVTSSGSKTTSIGGNDGGGNKVNPVCSGMDGDDNGGGVLHRSVVSDGVSSIREKDTWRKEEEEMKVWGEMVEEASRMKNEGRDEEIFNEEILKGFVSPISVEINGEEDVYYEDYFKTELNYQSGLAQDPNNVLLLANYAQFLYLVLHDFDRAEEYFKRAVKVEPKDAEAHNKYANFLWQVRNDLWGAEETFLEAISADPSNSYYAANYAHFLWNTGGEDTCFPLDESPDDETLDA